LTAASVLADVLRCPACGGELAASGGALTCSGCGAEYAVRDGAVWLAAGEEFHDERGGLATRALHRVVANPRVYDAVQRTVGTPETARRIRGHLAGASGKLVLDVGAGTGRLRPTLPEGATYLWLDADPAKLHGFRAKWPGEPAVVSDAAELPFRDASVDYALCVALAHHLADDELARLVDELARVVRERVILMEPLRVDALVPRALWRYDRGAHPRAEEELVTALGRGFEVETRERYAKLHRYLLVTARPR
jgi:SAM-dependent methyltransferase